MDTLSLEHQRLKRECVVLRNDSDRLLQERDRVREQISSNEKRVSEIANHIRNSEALLRTKSNELANAEAQLHEMSHIRDRLEADIRANRVALQNDRPDPRPRMPVRTGTATARPPTLIAQKPNAECSLLCGNQGRLYSVSGDNTCNGGRHEYCAACLSKYLNSVLASGKVPVKCPCCEANGHQSFFDLGKLQELATAGVLDRNLVQRYVVCHL